jgi:hypothetical protein
VQEGRNSILHEHSLQRQVWPENSLGSILLPGSGIQEAFIWIEF